MGEEGVRTQEDVNKFCSGVHHVGTPKSEMSGITWMSVKGEGSNNDHPRRIIGGEGRGVFGGYGRLGEEFDDFGTSDVVFGSGLEGHCSQTSQRGLTISWDVRTGSNGGRWVFLWGWKTLRHVTRLCQKLEGGTVDRIVSTERSGIGDGFWNI